jgi:DNA-binding XRE family transcriptional regulator
MTELDFPQYRCPHCHATNLDPDCVAYRYCAMCRHFEQPITGIDQLAHRLGVSRETVLALKRESLLDTDEQVWIAMAATTELRYFGDYLCQCTEEVVLAVQSANQEKKEPSS